METRVDEPSNRLFDGPVPTPTHTVFQLSDLHIVPEGDLLHDVVDTTANLVAALDRIQEAGIEVAALILSGDLADAGDLAAYERLRKVVEPAASRIGAPVLYGMGNHDERGPFRVGLLGAEPTTEAYDYVHWAGDLRIVMMDTTEPGHHHGELSADQLAWLAAELATPAPAGTVLALHHPPLPSPIPMINTLLLRNADSLAAVLAGSDVRIVLCGHSHHASAGILGGVPVWVAGATAYRADTLAAAGGMRGLTGGELTRIDVFPTGAVATAVPIEAGDPVYSISLADLQQHLTEGHDLAESHALAAGHGIETGQGIEAGHDLATAES